MKIKVNFEVEFERNGLGDYHAYLQGHKIGTIRPHFNRHGYRVEQEPTCAIPIGSPHERLLRDAKIHVMAAIAEFVIQRDVR